MGEGYSCGRNLYHGERIISWEEISFKKIIRNLKCKCPM